MKWEQRALLHLRVVPLHTTLESLGFFPGLLNVAIPCASDFSKYMPQKNVEHMHIKIIFKLNFGCKIFSVSL